MARSSEQGRILAKFNAMLKDCKRVNYQNAPFYHPEDIKSWMLKTDNSEHNVSNVGLLLHMCNPSGFASTQPDDIANALLVFAILLRLGCGHLIHIFQQFVHDDALDADLRRENLLGDLKRSNPPPPPDILDQFDRERWSFCPAKIEDMCHHTKAYFGGRWILPFCRRETVGEGGTATVYGVLVQADIVPDNLKNDVLRGYGFNDPEFGDCFQFAVKTYQDKNHDVFEREINNFSGLKDVPGVVKHLGWYKIDETDPSTKSRIITTYNILLEYGEQDLDEYLALRYPPVLNSETINFWENIFGVATTLRDIHNLKYISPGGVNTAFTGWHGDIKPSNILFAQGEFKLADFGFTKFELSRDGPDQKTALLGVTHTYGAPECDPGRLRKPTKTEHTKEIDTWSLGCVFSSVATWVVLGSFAYQQYPSVRKLAIEDLIKNRNANQSFEGPKADDSFHDGRKVLEDVKSWHKYLRSSMRKSDTITDLVLNLVEDHMLLQDPQKRMPSAKLVTELEKIIATAKAHYDLALKKHHVPPIPPETLKALLTLDDMAPAEFGLKAEPSQPVAHGRGSSLAPPTIRVGKSERVDGMVIQAKVAGRREVLADKLGELGEPYVRPEVNFVGRSAAVKGDAIPKIHRQGEGKKISTHRPTTPPPVMVTDGESMVMVSSPREVEDDLYATMGRLQVSNYSPSPESRSQPVANPVQTIHRQSEGKNTSTHRPGTHPPAMVADGESRVLVSSPREVEDEFYRDLGKRPLYNSSPSSDINTRPVDTLHSQSSLASSHAHSPFDDEPSHPNHSTQPTPFGITDHSSTAKDKTKSRDQYPRPPPGQSTSSVGSRMSMGRSTLMSIGEADRFSSSPIGSLRAELNRQWNPSGFLSFKRMANRAPADRKLKDFIKNRDIVFLVDNGWSMRPHWKCATSVLETLGMKIGPLDDDGLDLLFTRGSDNYRRPSVKGFDIPTQFREAMGLAKADDHPALYQTNMAQALKGVFSDYYVGGTSKKLTIIVLTTGEWGPPEDGQHDVETVVASYINALSRDRPNFQEERVCTVQFISFGDNEEGLQRLADLDDKLSHVFGIPDVIDTEPWTGDPNKMLLGSILHSVDRQRSGIDGLGFSRIGDSSSGPSSGREEHPSQSSLALPTPPTSPNPRASTPSLSNISSTLKKSFSRRSSSRRGYEGE